MQKHDLREDLEFYQQFIGSHNECEIVLREYLIKILIRAIAAEENYNTAMRNLDAAKKNYSIYSAKYKVGSITYLDLQSSSLSLNQSEAVLNNALFQYKEALANLNLTTCGALDNISS